MKPERRSAKRAPVCARLPPRLSRERGGVGVGGGWPLMEGKKEGQMFVIFLHRFAVCLLYLDADTDKEDLLAQHMG